MDVIFLLGSHPRDLTIAVRTGLAGYYGAYKLISTKYGWSDCDLITESDQFQKLDLRKLPAELLGDYDFQKKLPYLEIAYVYKKATKEAL